MKRILICTAFALAMGLCGGYLGGQIGLNTKKQQCKTWIQVPQFQGICHHIIIPPMALDEAMTGMWIGTIVGALMGGLVTRKAST